MFRAPARFCPSLVEGLVPPQVSTATTTPPLAARLATLEANTAALAVETEASKVSYGLRTCLSANFRYYCYDPFVAIMSLTGCVSGVCDGDS